MMKTRQLVLTAVFIAMVTVSTTIRIHIPLGTGGLIHLGTLVSFIIALRFGPRYGALAGGIGMTLFDLLSEWYVWAPATLIIRLTSGYLVGYFAKSKKGQGDSLLKNVLAILIGGVVIVVGYYGFEAFILGVGWVPALSSIPGNLTQIGLALFWLLVVPSIPRVDS